MSIFNDKINKSIAEAAAKIMKQEATHPKTEKEKDLAALGHPKDKITHKDVLIGRGVLKKEEADQGASKKKEEKFHMDLDKLVHKTFGHSPAEKKEKMKKEEVEQIDEMGYSAKAARAGKDIGKPGKMFAKIAKKAEAAGARSGEAVAGAVLKKLRKEEIELAESHFKVGDEVICKASGMEGEVIKLDKEHGDEDEKYYTVKREDGKTMKYAPNELKKAEDDEDEDEEDEKEDMKEQVSFTSLIESYKKEGLKSLSKMKKMNEEPDNEQFTKEVEDQKKSMKGEKKQPAVAAPATQGVKIMPEETEELDEEQLDELNKSTLASYVKRASNDASNVAHSMGARKERQAEVNRFTNRHETNFNDRDTLYNMLKVSNKDIGREQQKYDKRTRGIDRALSRLAKEEIELDEAEKMKGEDPCWKDYEMVGHKMKNGRKVPNCVPKNEEVELEERTLTEPEMKKKEEYVKSMKKKLSGFKDRYGERGKSVMYAVATKMAKEKA